MNELECLLSTLEVADMLDIDHWQLLRKLNGRTGGNGKHIRGYVEILRDNQVVVTDFFRESTYKTEQNKEMPCYKVTKKGCEFLANKFTGEKGILFTARYINRFHEMQEIISKQEPELPWFMRKFLGRYIVLERDFIAITGVDIRGRKPFYKKDYFTAGSDWNGFEWKCNNEEFKEKYGFDYGDEDCMIYFHLTGVIKALRILMNDKKVHMNPGAYELLQDGINKLIMPKVQKIEQKKPDAVSVIESTKARTPIQINIMITENGLRLPDTNIVKGSAYSLVR